MCDWKRTPSSLDLADACDSDMTWKPPESVRIGPSQRMNVVQAAERGDALRARAQHQVIGVGEHDVGAGGFHWSEYSALTVPTVPTGMNAGVRTMPRGVATRRGAAAPSVRHQA